MCSAYLVVAIVFKLACRAIPEFPTSLFLLVHRHFCPYCSRPPPAASSTPTCSSYLYCSPALILCFPCPLAQLLTLSVFCLETACGRNSCYHAEIRARPGPKIFHPYCSPTRPTLQSFSFALIHLSSDYSCSHSFCYCLCYLNCPYENHQKTELPFFSSF